MSIATIASLLLAIAKAIPACNELWDKFAAGWANHRAEQRRLQAHAQIDADAARVAAQPWVCPRTCPHKQLFDSAPANAAEPTPGTAGAP